MDNEMEFKKFIDENGILKDDGTHYTNGTKKPRLRMISKFIKESGEDIYRINDPKKIEEILESKKELIRDVSESHLKRGLEWYLEFLKLKFTDFKSADEISDTSLLEGAKKRIIVNAYERNLKARKKCIEKYGYNCFICKFNFEKKYGEIGKEFIHVHHLKALSEIQEEYEVNPLEDLRPVCPNCHAMLHRKEPAYSIEDIQNILTHSRFSNEN